MKSKLPLLPSQPSVLTDQRWGKVQDSSSRLDVFMLLHGLSLILGALLFMVSSSKMGAVQLLMGIPLGWLTFKRPVQGTALFFFLIPCTNFLGNILSVSYRAIPFLLGLFGCWALGVILSLGIRSASLPPLVMKYLVILQGFFTFSLIVSCTRWTGDLSQNILGWILLGYLIWTGGLLFIQLLATIRWYHPSSPSPWLYWEKALSLGFLVAVAMGGYQILGHPHFGNSPSSAFRYTLELNASFFDPNALGTSLILGVPLLLTRLEAKEGGPLWRWIWLIVVIGLFPLLFFSGSRSGLLGTGIAVSLLGLRRLQMTGLRVTKKFLILLLLGGVVLGSSLIVGGRTTRSLLDRVYKNPFRQEVTAPQNLTNLSRRLLGVRWDLWRSGWEAFRLYPLLGTGVGNYLPMLKRLRERFSFPVLNDNSGNYYLQVAAELGLLGLGIMVAFLGCTAVNGWRRLRHIHDYRLLGAFSGLVGMWVAFLFGPHVLSFEVSLLYWYQISVLWLAPSEETAPA